MYRTAWVSLVALTGALGVWASIRTWSVGGAVFIFVFAMVTAACVRLLRTKEGDPPEWRRAARIGGGSAAVALPALGLVACFGVAGLTVVALLAVLSPRALSAAGRWLRLYRHHEAALTGQPRAPGPDAAIAGRAEGTASGSEAAAVAAPSLLEAPWMQRPPQAMDDATLCFAWRTSYVALQKPWSLALRLRIVQRRQEFLDEFERRNSGGFSAWLASGARAAGDPSRYIAHSERRPRHRHQQ